MRYTIRPISDRTWLGSMGKEATRFSAKWSNTLSILGREVDHLRGQNVVIEIDVEEKDLRLNGELRSTARPSSPAVGLAFESEHGPLFYRCDRFVANYYNQGPSWQHNLRAIALTLEALRSVSRWGAVETGQQYQGFKALPFKASRMTRDEALAIFAMQGGALIDDVKADLRRAYRRARAAAHPDRHDGSREHWDQVEQAGEALGVA